MTKTQTNFLCNVTLNTLQPQPDPAPSTGDVWLEIINDLEDNDILKPYCIERRQQGIDRYGTPLQRDNGRDHLLDALQEALDMIAYVQAADDAVDDTNRQHWAVDANAYALRAAWVIAKEIARRKLKPSAQPPVQQECRRCGAEFSARVNYTYCAPCVDALFGGCCPD